MTEAWTEEERRQAVADLRRARPLIESGKERYICLAIDMYRGSRSRSPVPDEIERRLAPRVTVEAWLIEHGYAGDSTTAADFREYRLRWIDALIKEFGGKASKPGKAD